ncbi:MAG: TetR/AcrR family transcriptional regulator [Thomasclavelia sp.]|nr:TetR/AcrR family transcriptional regulator [Thomasclavelia sp.]
MSTLHFRQMSKYSKSEHNKNIKFNKLLDAAADLFADKSIHDISITEIVKKAGVAKGTFYLYFKDKYELQDYILVRTAYEILNDAMEQVSKEDINNVADKIIRLIDIIISYLQSNTKTINFIEKNLSSGLYSDKLHQLIDENSDDYIQLFINDLKNHDQEVEDPEITIYMVVELVSSTIFNSIVYSRPLPVDQFKPILYKKVKLLLN